MTKPWVIAILLALSCACTPPEPPFVRVGERAPPSESTTCPFGFRGARVAFEDTAEGVDIVLTGVGNAAELQHRARDAAAMYGPGSHRGLGHDGTHGNGLHHGLALDRLGVQVRAAEQNTTGGACIHVTAIDTADLAKVRTAVRARADAVRSGSCP
jgi:hypothetical protein